MNYLIIFLPRIVLSTKAIIWFRLSAMEFDLFANKILSLTQCLFYYFRIIWFSGKLFTAIWGLISTLSSDVTSFRAISSFLMLFSWFAVHSLVHAMCNRASCAQVHELPWGHWRIANNRESALSIFLTTYILTLDEMSQFRWNTQPRINFGRNNCSKCQYLFYNTYHKILY